MVLTNDDDAVEFRKEPTSHRRPALCPETDSSFDETAKKNRHLLVLLSEPPSTYVEPIVSLYIISQADGGVIKWFLFS